MDDLVPSVCQGCRKIYSGGFTKLEQFAGKWMCPSCIDIEKKKLQAVEDAAKRKRDAEQRAAAAAIAPTQTKPTAPVASKVAACKTCGGVVAIGAKMCPHCGQSKPAPKPPTQVTRKHLIIIAGLIVVYNIFIVTANRNSSPSGNQVDAAASELASYGRNLVLSAKPGSLSYQSAQKTTESPMRAYKVVFAINDPSLLSDPQGSSDQAAFLKNQGVALVWKTKFCTPSVSAIMARHQLSMVSGQLVNSSGEIQSLAICNA